MHHFDLKEGVLNAEGVSLETIADEVGTPVYVYSTATLKRHYGLLRAAAGAGFSTATDLADWLVRELNLPFRKAHHVTGAAVKRAEALGVDLSQLPLAELQSLEPGVTEAVYKVLTPEASCASRQSFGGTAPEQVRARIAEWKNRL